MHFERLTESSDVVICLLCPVLGDQSEAAGKVGLYAIIQRAPPKAHARAPFKEADHVGYVIELQEVSAGGVEGSITSADDVLVIVHSVE